MREIIFRGKAINLHNGSKEFVFGQYVQNRNGYFIYSDTWQNGIEKHQVIIETIGQYTGLTDKNGTKIFEGDIIQTKKTGLKGEKKYRFVIKYGKYTPLEYCREIYSQWQTIGFYAFDGKRDYQLSCCEDLLEVIGNIHDNPELLKGAKK